LQHKTETIDRSAVKKKGERGMASSVIIRGSVVRAAAVVIVALIAPLLVPAAGSAANGPCADDMAKFCKDVHPGGGSILKCMKEHENDLSPACKRHVAEMKEKAKEARKACADDVAQFCKDVQPGGGRIVKCLREHENDLSPDCKGQMGSRKGRK
jgi:hypothetical protein